MVFNILYTTSLIATVFTISLISYQYFQIQSCKEKNTIQFWLNIALTICMASVLTFLFFWDTVSIYSELLHIILSIGSIVTSSVLLRFSILCKDTSTTIPIIILSISILLFAFSLYNFATVFTNKVSPDYDYVQGKINEMRSRVTPKGTRTEVVRFVDSPFVVDEINNIQAQEEDQFFDAEENEGLIDQAQQLDDQFYDAYDDERNLL